MPKENERRHHQRLFDKYRNLFLIEDETVYVLRVRHQSQQTLQPDEATD